MRAVIYARVSSEDQVKGYSLPSQEEECLKLIQSKGYSYVDSYVDDGYSAKNTKRPALQRLLSDAEKNIFDVIVIWKLDRLSRNTIDGLTLVSNVFNQNKIGVISCTDNIDTSTAAGYTMLTILFAFAEYERNQMKERISMGYAKKARSTNLRVTNAEILGYDIVDGKIVVNKNESEIVKRIFHLYVYELYGFFKISNTLNAEGYRGKRGGHFYEQAVKHILRNRTYIGLNVWKPTFGDKNEIVSAGIHEPIITTEVFELASKRMDRKQNKELSASSSTHTFTGILKCSECGGRFHVKGYSKYKNSTFISYRCSNKIRNSCSATSISVQKIERCFFNYYNKLSLEINDYEVTKNTSYEKTMKSNRARIEREIEKLSKRRSTLLDLLGDGEITKEDYRNKITEINTTIESLHNELSTMSDSEQTHRTLSSAEVIEFIRNIQENWEYMNDKEKKYLLQLIFKSIYIKKTDGKWEIDKIEFN